MRKKLFIWGVIAMALSQALANATTSVSVASLPQGMVVISTGSQGSTNYISLPLSSNAIYTGSVNSVGSNTINVSNSPFTINLANIGAPYFVKFLSGTEAGRTLLITGNTTNSLTVSTTDNSTQSVNLQTSNFAVNSGDSFEVVPGDTLGSLFGTNTTANPLSITGASSYVSADWVNIYNPTTGSWQIYFFNTSLNYWTLEGSSGNANSTVLYPYSGLSITRHSSSEPVPYIVLTGRVPEVQVMVKTTGSNAITYVSTGYPVGMTLSQLNLGSNWTKGTTTATADVVSVWNSSTRSFVSYYQLPSSAWCQAGSPTANKGSTVLPPGCCLALQQHATVSGATSYLTLSVPYAVSN
jgi:uncharacterized protein (TIGR02597 family)